MTNEVQVQRKKSNKHVSEIALACYRTPYINPKTKGILVLVPGHQNSVFGYYLASERQVGLHWVYETHAFSVREDNTTYIKLVEALIKQTDPKHSTT